jgi:hypothetical protein
MKCFSIGDEGLGKVASPSLSMTWQVSLGIPHLGMMTYQGLLTLWVVPVGAKKAVVVHLGHGVPKEDPVYHWRGLNVQGISTVFFRKQNNKKSPAQCPLALAMSRGALMRLFEGGADSDDLTLQQLEAGCADGFPHFKVLEGLVLSRGACLARYVTSQRLVLLDLSSFHVMCSDVGLSISSMTT